MSSENELWTVRWAVAPFPEAGERDFLFRLGYRVRVGMRWRSRRCSYRRPIGRKTILGLAVLDSARGYPEAVETLFGANLDGGLPGAPAESIEPSLRIV